MELSGHSPFIVFEDADLDKVTDIAILLNLEIMVKYVSLLAVFIFIQAKKKILLI